jgi:hypothetical protein
MKLNLMGLFNPIKIFLFENLKKIYYNIFIENKKILLFKIGDPGAC